MDGDGTAAVAARLQEPEQRREVDNHLWNAHDRLSPVGWIRNILQVVWMHRRSAIFRKHKYGHNRGDNGEHEDERAHETRFLVRQSRPRSGNVAEAFASPEQTHFVNPFSFVTASAALCAAAVA